ncbi:serine/threonine-protein kinase Nek5 [Acrasis kona]|uniref:non-specific serine/threonine protein kinase n=1 Tax=Acrasis kona TaxID=1008807 RepID=A0AAW2ZMK8_9EUKA
MSIAGEEDYMSFEMKSQKPYSSKTDMWSFECVLYELMSLKHKNMSNDYLEAIADERLSEFRSELKQDMNISGMYPQSLIELVIKLLQRRDEDRPTASQIVQMRDLFGDIEVVRADEQQECVICMDAAKSHACSPCGHKVVCEECAEIVIEGGVCPICRANVIHCIRIYE